MYQYLADKRKFVVPPTVAGKVDYPELVRGRITLGDAVRQIAQAGLTRFIPDVSQEPMLFARNPAEPEKQRFVEREGVKSCAVAVLKVQQEEKIVGVMFVNYKRAFEFSTSERRTIGALASSVAIAINTRRLHDRAGQDLSRREKEHNAMIAVDRAIVAGATDLEHVLGLILAKALEIIGAPYDTIMLYNKWERVLEPTVEKGMPRSGKGLRQRLEEGIVGQAARTRESVLVADVTAEEWASIYKRVIPSTRAELAVPLVDEGDLLGVFNLEHPELDAFDADDQALMETLALQPIIAIHSVTLSQKLERQIRPLRALSTIAPRIPDARHDLDTVLRLLLVGVTAGAGLGFSRAMLFLRDDDGVTLRGKLAIGARTRDEAERTWKRLAEAALSLPAEDADSLEPLLNAAVKFSRAIKDDPDSDYPLSKAVQAITIPMDINEGGAPAACALNQEFVIVKDDQPDPFRSVIKRVSSPGDFGRAFACVPLVEQRKSLGVLVVDNRFLISERRIEEVDVKISLSAYASVAAMRIENARVQERLTEEQRQATWKEFTSKMAHVIGSRIAVIEGVASKLRNLIVEDASNIERFDDIQQCSRQLTNVISKAKSVLTQLRQFGGASVLGEEEEFDLIDLIKGILDEMRPVTTCPVETHLPEGTIRIRGNHVKLENAFTELLANAQLAVQENGSTQSTIGIAACWDSQSVHRKRLIRIEFRNTGAYIPPERKKIIFEPYVTSRATGTGLGLAIVRSVVEEHGGTIEEVGTEQEGVRFVLKLPAVD